MESLVDVFVNAIAIDDEDEKCLLKERLIEIFETIMQCDLTKFMSLFLEDSDSDDENADAAVDENNDVNTTIDPDPIARFEVGFSDIDSSANKYRGRACTPESSMSDTATHDSDMWVPERD